MKISKKENSELFRIAAELPPTFYEVGFGVEVTGQYLIDQGIRPDAEPNKKYVINTTQLRQTNHYRRLKKLFLKEGVAAVKEYVERVKELAEGIKPIEGLNYEAARF